MKLLDKKDVFAERRLQEQQMVVKGAQISDLVNKHQKKLNEAKQEFVSEVEKQKQVFDEMVESYMAKLGVLKSEVAELTMKRQELLEPLDKEEERLKTLETTLLDREEAVKAKFDLVETSARQAAIHEKALKQQDLDIQEKTELITLDFLNAQKKLGEAENFRMVAKLNAEKTEKLLNETRTQLDARAEELDRRDEDLKSSLVAIDVMKKVQKDRDSALDEKENQVKTVYLALQKAIELHQSKL